MLKPKIYINQKLMPASWADVSWIEFENMLLACNQNVIAQSNDTPEVQSNISSFEYFSGVSIDDFANEKGIELSELVFEHLSFLVNRPLPIELSFNIAEKSIAHKLISLNFIRKSKDNPELCFPYILATYESEKANINYIKKIYNDLIQKSVQEIYPIALTLFIQICENEAMLSKNLSVYQIPTTAEEKLAGVEKLQQDTHDIALIHTLANNEFLKYEEAKSKEVSEVNSFLILKQRFAHYEYNLRKRHEEKMKALQKSKKR